VGARFTPQSRAAVTKRLRELVPAAEEQIAKAQEDSAKELAEAIKTRAPSHTGRYRESIEAGKIAGRNDGRKPIGIAETKDPNAWGIFASYLWRWIEFGTRPHTIKAKRKSQLAFTVDGRQIRTRQVNHPGTTKQSHIFPTYRQYRKRIRRRVLRAIRNVINGK
jgi:hypothetical protein